MKKMISLTLALMLALCALAVPALAEEEHNVKVGMLSMLNMSEEEAVNYLSARNILRTLLSTDAFNNGDFAQIYGGEIEVQSRPVPEVVYYDSLDAMLMALNSGEITNMSIYDTTAQYLIHNNPDLVKALEYSDEESLDSFARLAFHSLMTNDFAFMFMEENTALRDEFDEALSSITDEEMAKLIEDHINAPTMTGEVTPVDMPAIEGAETVKVAVTGSLPPMDYVAADGKPAGFNTALLAEISQRIGKNIELVIVDSVGRAAALASGTVDAVFWTRTSSYANHFAELSDEERTTYAGEIFGSMSEEAAAVMEGMSELIDYTSYGSADLPEGTIITKPYYSDTVVPIMTKEAADAMRTQLGK